MQHADRTHRKTRLATEKVAGTISLATAIGSIAVLTIFLWRNKIGLDPSTDMGLRLLAGYAIFEVVALATGFWSRRTKVGMSGLVVATTSLAVMLMVTGYAIQITKS